MAVSSSRVYAVNITRVDVTGAITLMQVKAGASTPLQILRCAGGQSLSVTSTQQPIQINRKSGAGTVTAFTPLLLGPADDPAAKAVGGTSATGVNASGEGTDTDVLWQGVFNIVGEGWLYLPGEKERIFVPPGGILGVKLPIAPAASLRISGQVIFEELN